MQYDPTRAHTTAALILLGVVIVLTVVLGSFFVRLNESRLVINCSSFSSYGDLMNFIRINPGYDKRLDHNGDGRPCTDIYGKTE